MCLSAAFRHLQSFHSLIALLMTTLFEVSLEISCSDESSHYCCYGNHTAGSKSI